VEGFCGYVFPSCACKQTHVVVHDKVVQDFNPTVVTGQGVPLRSDISEKGKFSTWDSRKIVMLDMIPDVITNIVHRSIVGIGGLSWDEFEMFRNKVTANGMKGSSDNTSEKEIKEGLPSKVIKNGCIKAILDCRDKYKISSDRQRFHQEGTKNIGYRLQG